MQEKLTRVIFEKQASVEGGGFTGFTVNRLPDPSVQRLQELRIELNTLVESNNAQKEG